MNAVKLAMIIVRKLNPSSLLQMSIIYSSKNGRHCIATGRSVLCFLLLLLLIQCIMQQGFTIGNCPAKA